jgi:hypothetical protein
MAGYPTDLLKAADPLPKWCTPAVVEVQVSAAERVELERLLEWRAPLLEEVQVSAAKRVKLERLADRRRNRCRAEKRWPAEKTVRASLARRVRGACYQRNPTPPITAMPAERAAAAIGRRRASGAANRYLAGATTAS